MTHTSFEQRFDADGTSIAEVAAALAQRLDRDRPKVLVVDEGLVHMEAPLRVLRSRLGSIRGVLKADFAIRWSDGTMSVNTSLVMHGPIAMFALGVWTSLIANVMMAIQEGARSGTLVPGHVLATAFPFLFALWGRFGLSVAVRMMVSRAVSDAQRLRDLS